jgi:kynurenine formamidase
MADRSSQIIDLSYDLEASTPVYPGDAGVEIKILETSSSDIPGRRALNNSRLSISIHTGTHMDAPFHFFDGGKTIDHIPLDRFCGPALCVDVEGAKSIDAAKLKPFEQKFRKYPKVILHTGWASHWKKPDYFTDHPCLTGDSAQFLVDSGVHLVGLDTPSVDQPPFPAHLVLLGNDVVIVENLRNLDAIPQEVFEFTVLPLKIVARDGSPARAIARPL